MTDLVKISLAIIKQGELFDCVNTRIVTKKESKNLCLL